MMNFNRNFWAGKRIFLTGHTGFKGAWLSFVLKELGADVKGFSLAPNTTPNLSEELSLNLTEQIGDIREATVIAESIKEFSPQIILHLAAQPLVRRSYHEPQTTYETNVMGTLHLLEASRCLDDLMVALCVTTDKVYENKEIKYPYKEDDKLGGYDPYSSSKAASDILTQSYRRSFFNKVDAPKIITVRAGNVIGGGDWAEDRLLPDAAQAYSKGKALEIRSPNSIRPWQHVLEPVFAYLLIVQEAWKAHDSDIEFKSAWNIGPKPEATRSVREVIDTFTKYWGGEAAWLDRSTEQSNSLHEAGLLELDITQAQKELSWNPLWDLDIAVKRTAEWYKDFYQGVSAQDLMHRDLNTYLADLENDES